MDTVNAIVAYATGRPVLTIISAVVAGLAIQSLIRFYRHRRFFKDLPGPPHSFLWGHLKVMGEMAALFPPNMHPQAYFTEMARMYDLGGIFYLDLWPVGPSQVILRDPVLQEQVTVVKPLHQHAIGRDLLEPIAGRNVIATVNGPVWKRLHSAMGPAFSWGHIRSVTGVMVDECELFRAALDRRAAAGDVFSFEELSGLLVFDIIARVVFNTRLNAQTTGSEHLADLRELVVLAEGLTDVVAGFNPIHRFRQWLKRQAVLRRLNPAIRSKIFERLGLLHQKGVVPSRKDPNSILDLMLREQLQDGNKEQGSVKADVTLSAFDQDLLVTNVKALLLGGLGTTNDSLCYIMMLLSKHPDAVAKLRKEHTAVLADSHEGTVENLLAAPENLQNIPYTEAVIKEALRLFPVGFGVRVAPPGTTLHYEGRDLPIDNNLAIAPNAQDVHYDPRYYPEPTRFRPERWLDPQNEIPRSHFRTFSRGQRACLGQNLAQNVLKVILVMVVRDYEFSCADLKPNARPRASYSELDTVYGDVVFQEMGLEAKPRGGMHMTVKKT